MSGCTALGTEAVKMEGASQPQPASTLRFDAHDVRRLMGHAQGASCRRMTGAQLDALTGKRRMAPLSAAEMDALETVQPGIILFKGDTPALASNGLDNAPAPSVLRAKLGTTHPSDRNHQAITNQELEEAGIGDRSRDVLEIKLNRNHHGQSDITSIVIRQARPLEVRNVRAIQSLTVADWPSIVLLVGPNASGKTSLLHALALQGDPGRQNILTAATKGQEGVRGLFHEHQGVRARWAAVTLGRGSTDRVTLRRCGDDDQSVELERGEVRTKASIGGFQQTSPAWTWGRTVIWLDRAQDREKAEQSWQEMKQRTPAWEGRSMVLLIDEFENAMERARMEQRWRDTIVFAQRTGAEIVATTHSVRCITEFAKACAKLGADQAQCFWLNASRHRTRAQSATGEPPYEGTL